MYRANATSWSEPIGLGARVSLGRENCLKCGATGWMDVGNNTVDVCSCRSGKPVRKRVPRSKRQYVSIRQKATNADGVASVKEVLGYAKAAAERRREDLEGATEIDP